MKKLLMVFMISVFVCAGASLVNSGEIIDVQNGNGISALVSLTNIGVRVDFLKNEPNDRSKDRLVKYSIPYDGTSKSDGYLYATEGMVFEGHLGYADNKDLIAETVVGKDGKGPLIFNFPNPTKAGQPVDMVFWAVLKGTKNQYICPPWESKLLYFAKPNPNHPKGTQHTVAFAVSGDKVIDVVAKARAAGWKPAYDYWREKGVMGPPSWALSNLMSGVVP